MAGTFCVPLNSFAMLCIESLRMQSLPRGLRWQAILGDQIRALGQVSLNEAFFDLGEFELRRRPSRRLAWRKLFRRCVAVGVRQTSNARQFVIAGWGHFLERHKMAVEIGYLDILVKPTSKQIFVVGRSLCTSRSQARVMRRLLTSFTKRRPVAWWKNFEK